MLASALDFVEVGDELFDAGILGFFGQHFAVADDGVHRCPELMAHIGKKCALCPVSSFGIIACGHGLDTGGFGGELCFMCERGCLACGIFVELRGEERR